MTTPYLVESDWEGSVSRACPRVPILLDDAFNAFDDAFENAFDNPDPVLAMLPSFAPSIPSLDG